MANWIELKDIKEGFKSSNKKAKFKYRKKATYGWLYYKTKKDITENKNGKISL